MATKYVELTYLDGPPMFASIDSRTPNKVSGHGDITELQRRGYKIVTLLLATPERINALEDIDNLLGELLNCEEIEAWLTPRRVDVIERKREAINAMLQEMKGATDGE